jgi:hypothetical protein
MKRCLQEFEVALLSKNTKETMQILEEAENAPQISSRNLIDMAKMCFEATVKDISAAKRAVKAALSQDVHSNGLAPGVVCWVRPQTVYLQMPLFPCGFPLFLFLLLLLLLLSSSLLLVSAMCLL